MKHTKDITSKDINPLNSVLQQTYAVNLHARQNKVEQQSPYYNPLRSPMFVGNTNIDQLYQLFHQLTLQYCNVLDTLPDLAQKSLENTQSYYNNNLLEEIQIVEDHYNSTKGLFEIDGQFKMTSLFNVNDYLGLSKNKMVIAASMAATSMYGTGGLGSRLIRGTTDLHIMLEESLTKFKGLGKKGIDTITLPSGYMANLTLMSLIRDGKGTVILDKKAHQSLIDGCQLSKSQGLKVKRFEHNDIEHLRNIIQTIRKNNESSHKICIVIDGVYSMDGALAPLPELQDIAREFDCFIILDDAHSTGTVGKKGRGTLEFFGIEDWEDHFIIMGTLGKSLGSIGGFITAREDIIQLIKYSSHQIIYSTALTPPTLATALTSLKIIEETPELVSQLHQNTEYLQKSINDLGFETGNTQTHIIPIITGRGKEEYAAQDDFLTLELSNYIKRRGYYAPPILRPAVQNQRLRVSVSAEHTMEQMNGFLEVLKEGKSKILN